METNDSKLPARRLAAIDAFRGLVMFLMLAEVLHLSAVAKAKPESSIWEALAHHQSHVPWVGCSLHDLIQPGFSFLVGAALPFSIASRRSRGQSSVGMTLHASWRALILIFLGIFLRSMSRDQTNYTFEDTLTQIGLGYPFLFLLGLRPKRDHWIGLGLILVGYWAAFAFYPLPSATLDASITGVPPDWPHQLSGFAAHWNKNTNLAWAFDRWFMNLFPREKPFAYNGGGYSTLNFIPTLGTMILGLLASDVIRSERSSWAKLGWLVGAGLICLLAGWGLGASGICPVVKRIWTPSWVLFSGGWCFLFLAAFYATLDMTGRTNLAFPLLVVGMNSIAAYLMSWLFEGFISRSLTIHLGEDLFKAFGDAYAPFLHGAAVLLIFWLILFWMYRRRIFLRI